MNAEDLSVVVHIVNVYVNQISRKKAYTLNNTHPVSGENKEKNALECVF